MSFDWYTNLWVQLYIHTYLWANNSRKKVCKWKEHNEFTVFTIPPLYAPYSIIDDKFYIIDIVRENISWFRSTPVMYQVCLVDNAYDRYENYKRKTFYVHYTCLDQWLEWLSSS